MEKKKTKLYEVVSKDYKIKKKRSGRYAVIDNNKKYINGDKKVKILTKEGLLKKSKAAPKKEAAQEGEAAAKSE